MILILLKIEEQKEHITNLESKLPKLGPQGYRDFPVTSRIDLERRTCCFILVLLMYRKISSISILLNIDLEN